MKTQHLYFRYFSNIDLSIKIVFSSDNCTLHILSKDNSLYSLIVNMHCLKVLVQKQVILLPDMFRMSDLYFCIMFSYLNEWITFCQPQNGDLCSPYQGGATSRKYQGVFEVKSRVKTWQVRGIWPQQLEHKQVPQWGTEPGVRKGKRSLLACHTRCKCSMGTTHNRWRSSSVSMSWNWWKVWLVGKSLLVKGQNVI